MIIEKLKINYKTQSKTSTDPPIKNHQRSHDVILIRHIFKFLTLLTPSVEKIANLHGFKSFYKPSNINAISSQCGPKWRGRASEQE
jgi:hypothetical protein